MQVQVANTFRVRYWLLLTSGAPTPRASRVPTSGLQTKHRGMTCLQNLAIAQVHVNTTRQAGIEAPDRTHDINSFDIYFNGHP